MKWRLIDSHCHINMAAFDSDRPEVVERAHRASVALVNSGVDLESNVATKALLTYKNVFASYGLSPVYYKQASEVIRFIRQNVGSACAIGEVGLDFYHVKQASERTRQENTLFQFIRLSKELGLALILHTRDAEERVFELAHNVDTAVYHCYGGSVELAKKIVDCGHYVSISTRVCRSAQHKELLKVLPREHVVIETDSPFLSCHKGRNEPIFVEDALRVVSRVWEEELEDTASMLVNNTKNALNLV
ncbi:MAG: TatD family hydrolase [Euryarchaeota archaeon]|nr:TatD family hydrolase [Euryarchaeota archaeon]